MSFENKNLRCHDCHFWWPMTEGAADALRRTAIFGQCRRLSPPPLMLEVPDRQARYASWSSTKRDDWCGEHAHLETL